MSERKIKQCPTCPWRVGADVNNIPNYRRELHEKLDRTIAKPADLTAAFCSTIRIMACHYSTERKRIPCAGWLHNQIGPGNNIVARLRVMTGAFAVPKVDGEQHETFEDTLCSVRE